MTFTRRSIWHNAWLKCWPMLAAQARKSESGIGARRVQGRVRARARVRGGGHDVPGSTWSSDGSPNSLINGYDGSGRVHARQQYRAGADGREHVPDTSLLARCRRLNPGLSKTPPRGPAPTPAAASEGSHFEGTFERTPGTFSIARHV